MKPDSSLIDGVREEARSAALARWKQRLVFRIGEGESVSPDQLPPLHGLPGFALVAQEAAAPYWLGHVIGVACIKLYRSTPVEDESTIHIGTGWLTEIVDLVGDSYRQNKVGLGCLLVLGAFLDVACNKPSSLPLLLSRIDALDNDALHQMAMDAVQGKDAGLGVFDGIWKDGHEFL